MVKTIFKSEDKWSELHVFEYGGKTFNTFEKTYIALNIEDF